MALALELLGDRAANAVTHARDRIDLELDGNWEAFAAAVRKAGDRLREDGSAIKDLVGWCLKVANDFALLGIPVELSGDTVPRKPRDPGKDPAYLRPFNAQAYMEQSTRRAKGRGSE